MTVSMVRACWGVLVVCALHSVCGCGSHSTSSQDGSPSAGQGGSSQQPSAAPARFRVSELYLRDPHLFLTGIDITEPSSLGVSVNADLIHNGLTTDYDADGFVDVSILATLTPFDPSSKSATLQLVDGQCAAKNVQDCKPHPMPGLNAQWTVDNQASGTCLSALENTTGNYSPEVSVPVGPCFVSTEGADVAMVLGGVRIDMTATKLAATYDGEVLRGLISGFVTQAKAKAALLPAYIPLLGGTPISDYLHDSDRDLAASPNGEDGYWFYVNFVAEALP